MCIIDNISRSENHLPVHCAFITPPCGSARRAHRSMKGRSSSISGATNPLPRGREWTLYIISIAPSCINQARNCVRVRRSEYADVTGHKSRVRVQTRLHTGDDYRGRDSPPSFSPFLSLSRSQSGPYKCINPTGR